VLVDCGTDVFAPNPPAQFITLYGVDVFVRVAPLIVRMVEDDALAKPPKSGAVSNSLALPCTIEVS